MKQGKQQACARTIKHIDGGVADPSLEFVHGQRYVLRKIFVEDPYFTVLSGSRYTMAIVVKQDPFVSGIATQAQAQFFDVFHRRVQTLLVPRPGLPSFVLRLQCLPYSFNGFLWRQRQRINPTFISGVGGCFHHVRRIRTNVQTHDDGDLHRLHSFTHSPRGDFVGGVFFCSAGSTQCVHPIQQHEIAGQRSFLLFVLLFKRLFPRCGRRWQRKRGRQCRVLFGRGLVSCGSSLKGIGIGTDVRS